MNELCRVAIETFCSIKFSTTLLSILPPLQLSLFFSLSGINYWIENWPQFFFSYWLGEFRTTLFSLSTKHWRVRCWCGMRVGLYTKSPICDGMHKLSLCPEWVLDVRVESNSCAEVGSSLQKQAGVNCRGCTHQVDHTRINLDQYSCPDRLKWPYKGKMLKLLLIGQQDGCYPGHRMPLWTSPVKNIPL